MPPLSDLWATDLLGDLCATVLNMLKTSRRPWRPWRCLNVLCTTLERPRQPFCLPSAFNGDLDSFVVAQGRHRGRSPCVKGVLQIYSHHHVQHTLKYLHTARSCWFYPYRQPLAHLHCSIYTMISMPMKQPWRIWVFKPQKSSRMDKSNQTKYNKIMCVFYGSYCITGV